MSIAGQCPECTYSLQGLTTPRCPECGVELHPRLLAEPHLAIPRPAWERRPHVSRRYAVARTFWDITRHPRKFFISLQYSDRLHRAVIWHIALPLLACVFIVVARIAFVRLMRTTPTPTFPVYWYTGMLFQAAWNAGFLIAIVELPLLLSLVAADFVLWRDRKRFRLFAKAMLYSSTVYLWFAVLLCVGTLLLRALLWLDWSPLGWELTDPGAPWPNWMLAALISWQYLLVLYGLSQRRFACFLRSREAIRRSLVACALSAWALGIYLVLFECLFGWRYIVGQWGTWGRV